MITPIQDQPLFHSESFLREQYLGKGLNIAEIARLIFSSRAAVRNGLKKHGISIRSQDDQPKNKTQLRYGEALRRRVLVGYKRELAAIKKMQKLREQNFSYWKIADVLNSMAVPTKTGRGQWHARSVKEVLSRP